MRVPELWQSVSVDLSIAYALVSFVLQPFTEHLKKTVLLCSADGDL